MSVVLQADRPLTEDEVVAVTRHGAPVEISTESLARPGSARGAVDEMAASSTAVYGISTGFGALATRQIPAELRTQLRRSLVRSHAASSGEEVKAEVIRGLMLLRLQTMKTGRAGVRTETAASYAALLNAGITPVVRELGSLGCSGDLAPLAHAALAVMGDGEVRVAGGLLPAAKALAEAGIPPVVLAEKEGLALAKADPAGVTVDLAAMCLLSVAAGLAAR